MVGPVVVGVDGSESSIRATQAAAVEARLRGVRLQVVHAYGMPAWEPPLGFPPDRLRATAEQVAADAAACALAEEPEAEVIAEVEQGDPLVVLEAHSRAAALVVVGNRGRGAFAGLLLGSTGVQLAAHSHCPVMVVRDGAPARGPVVVGVDGSATSDAALDFAFAEASLRRTGVRAVHAWTVWNTEAPAPQDPSMPYAAKPGELAAQEERLLAEAVAGHRERYPDVRVEQAPLRHDTREALIEASRQAQLVVVGSRGRGGFTGMLLGSVSQAVLHHALCSVVVVPHRN